MKRFITIFFVVLFYLSLINISASWALDLKIDYKEVLTPLFERNAQGINSLVNSADGTKLAFRTVAENGTSGKDRLYVMNTDGTNLMDLTTKLYEPTTVFGLADLQLNKSGSRLFFRGQCIDDYQGICIWVFDIGKGEFLPFKLSIEGWYDWRKSFGINAEGNRVYYKDWIRLDENSKPGFYKCTVSDNLIQPQGCIQYLNIEQLPLGNEIGTGPLRFLGHSMDADRTLFAWTNDVQRVKSMWVIEDAGLYPGPINFIPKKVTSDFDWMWITQNLINEIISANGRLALALIDDQLFGGGPKMFVIDLDSEAEKPTLFKMLVENAVQLTWPHISPSGRYARFTCPDHNFTRYELKTDQMRDTISWLNNFVIQQASNITEDDRYYFISRIFWNPQGFNVVQIYKIDMAATDFSSAPDINDIKFINRGLDSDGNTKATITAFVTDAQGSNTIQWVKLMGLLNGIERDGNSTGPLNFTADFYDNGTNGDITPRDGIYTNSSVLAIKEFFQDIAKPIKIGIRIVARDDEGHYTIVDSVLKEEKGRKAMPWSQLLLLDD
jgi:hypothetical protein